MGVYSRATPGGWPARRGLERLWGHPWRLACPARPSGNASGATPGGWPARRSHWLKLTPLGPPLAAGLPGAAFRERLWGHPWRLAWLNRLSQRLHCLLQAFDFGLRIVVDKADAHHAALFLKAETIGDGEGVVVAVPDVDVVVAKRVGNGFGSPAVQCEGEGWHALLQPVRVGDAPYMEAGDG